MIAEKNTLRRQVREEIENLPGAYIKSSNDGILSGVAALKEFKDAQTLLLFYSIDREPDTLRLALEAFNMGKTVAFPYCYRGGRMDARVVSSLGELKPAMLGIPAPPETARIIEPCELQLVVVPALTYDNQGFRLGYGGGYYDRYLAGLGAFTVGIARQRLLRQTLPKEPHDIPVKCLITEEGQVFPADLRDKS